MTETPPSPRPRRRWTTPLLILSLTANLLVIGVIVGWLLSPHGPRAHSRDHAWATRGFVAEPFVRAFSEEDRRAMFTRIARDRPFRDVRGDFAARIPGLLDAIRADPFDPAAISDVFDAQRSDLAARQRAGESLLLERLSEMTPEERAAYADRLEERFTRVKRRFGRN